MINLICSREADKMDKRTYIAIDLKSFYASVECMERGLDPMTTNLVVADKSRTEKTICLAVSPSLKSYGIPGRARLFEVVQKVGEVNALRRQRAPGHKFSGSSCQDPELKKDPALAVDYVVAPPQMAHYMKISGQIYEIYLKYIAPEDIHVYSIDEVFIDAASYLRTYQMTARELAVKMIRDVLDTVGITATAGIGSNLYLCKVAMDIGAKHIPADENGVRIAELDEISYRQQLWGHRPLTDFWRVGRGYARKLEECGLFTMGDIARCSLGKPTDYHNEDLLYGLFGVNAELLIDHAWGWEPCTIADIKAYKPQSSSVGSGQVLQCPYPFEKARLVAREMADLLVLDLVDKRLVTDQIVLTWKDGRAAHLTAGVTVASDRSGCIYGDRGYLVVENINNPQSISVFDADHRLIQQLSCPAQLTGYEYEVLETVQCIREEKTECPSMPHRETVHIMELMDRLRAQMGVSYPCEGLN